MFSEDRLEVPNHIKCCDLLLFFCDLSVLGVCVFWQIPPELVKMAEEFQAKVDSGQARKASGGFSGKGFTFDDSEQSESQQVSGGMMA